MTNYKTDINLGEQYTDTQTGYEGIATGVYFYQFGCERVSLECMREGKLVVETFDAPRLRHAETGKIPRVKTTGGPGNGHERRSAPTR